VPIEINETKVHLDFHIFAILDFELLIGYPFEKLFQKNSQGSLNEKMGKLLSPLTQKFQWQSITPNMTC